MLRLTDSGLIDTIAWHSSLAEQGNRSSLFPEVLMPKLRTSQTLIPSAASGCTSIVPLISCVSNICIAVDIHANTVTTASTTTATR